MPVHISIMNGAYSMARPSNGDIGHRLMGYAMIGAVICFGQRLRLLRLALLERAAEILLLDVADTTSGDIEPRIERVAGDAKETRRRR
jgi:hypothetical protein